MRLGTRWGAAALAGPIALSCGGSPSDEKETQRAEQASHSAADAMVCSQRNWRLASPLELRRVVIQASHILIRHVESQPRQAPLVVPDWNVLLPPPDRSREEALRLATTLRTELHRNVGAFSELAAQHSEDPLTASQGGSLGILAASDVRLWPEVLDALAETPPGNVSEVVETPWGVHVFLRESPPAVATISAKRILIGHADAPWLQFVERQDGTHDLWRERDSLEALELATRLTGEVRASPERFDVLVQEYSDHWDAAQGGDVGSWSSLEPGPYSRALAVVGQAAEGEIVGPISTFLGWTVWQRTSSTARPSFAMRSLRFRYDPLQPAEAPASKANAERQAREVLMVLRREPQRFVEFESQYGEQPQRWERGRGRRGVELALTRTKVGDLAHDLIDADWAFLIAQRMDPHTMPPRPVPLTKVPSPDRVAVEYHIAGLTDESREDLLRRAVRTCNFRNQLSDSVGDRFREAVSALSADLAGSIVERERLAISLKFLGTLEKLLGSHHFGCLYHQLDVSLRPGLLR